MDQFVSKMESVIQAVGEEEFRRVITRSVVGLGCTITPPGATEGKYFHASGFILSIEDNWFFITAGHVLKLLEDHRVAGYILGKWHFDDSANWKQVERRIPPPFTFDPEDTIWIESAEGKDHAAILIKPFHRTELEANGKVAFTEEQWRPNWKVDSLPDIRAMCILGVPYETVSTSGTTSSNGLTNVDKRMAYCEVTQIAESEVPEDKRRLDQCFYGIIADELFDDDEGLGVESIKGMSGGPIIALEITSDGTIGTYVLAIQSAWYPQSRIIIGCPIIGFPEFVVERIQRMVTLAEEESG